MELLLKANEINNSNKKKYTIIHCAILLSHKSSEELMISQLKWYQMFTSGALWRRSFIMMFNWGMVALVYYGIGMSMTQLGGDIFINFILAAVGEILGYLYNIIVANYWGRKPAMIVG